jgi:hypothetical protein
MASTFSAFDLPLVDLRDFRFGPAALSFAAGPIA